jgi:hypothetical protein
MKCSSSSSSSTTPTLPKRHVHTLKNYPDQLKKKVTLLVHFKAHLCNNNHNKTTDTKTQESTTIGTTAAAKTAAEGDLSAAKIDPNCVAAGGNGMTYVKKWVRTNRCLLFRLSDRSVQVAFFDNTEIILSQDVEVITLTYINKEKVRTSYSLQGVMESSKSHILKRLRYCKAIIHELLSGKLTNHNGKSKSSGSSSSSSSGSSKRSSSSSTREHSTKSSAR